MLSYCQVVHLVSDGIQNSVIRLAHISSEHPSALGELQSWPYPEHAGSRRLKSWLEIVTGLHEGEEETYEFGAFMPREFSILRHFWWKVAMGTPQFCELSEDGPRDSKWFRLSSNELTLDLCDGDKNYVTSLEVPRGAAIDSLITENWHTGGKSGAPLYFSVDRKLVIKMIDEAELAFLARLVPSYLEHVQANPSSLLVRIAGLYQIRMRPQQELFSFVVMYNAAPFPGTFAKYDLKGSTSNRSC